MAQPVESIAGQQNVVEFRRDMIRAGFRSQGRSQNSGEEKVETFTSRRRPRILIADDHVLIAEGYAKLLEPEYEVVGTVADGHALLQQAVSLHPHLVLVDVAMPLLNGLDAGQQIKHKMPDVKIIFVTMNHDVDLIAEAFRRGASGFLPKTAAAAELLPAIREVLNGRMYLSPALAAATIRSLQRRSEGAREPVALTGRQREVLQLLAEGKLVKEVSSVLNMKDRTVAFHKYRIMEKLNLHNTTELVRYAVRNNIIAA